MSHGMFNSSSSSSSSSGRSTGVGLLVELPPQIGIPILILVVCFSIWSLYATAEKEKAEAALDSTVYATTAADNYERWNATRSAAPATAGSAAYRG